MQEARKQAGLEVEDRITLGVSGNGPVDEALSKYRDLLMAETLAEAWQVGQAGAFEAEGSLDEASWRIEISRLQGA